MDVFICWSGDLSRKLAELLHSWLPCVLQAVRPYFTPEDVQKGARWSPDISKHLEASSIGILCLTFENLEAPWIMFEAGALAKHLDQSRVCPILFGHVETTDVRAPLVQFQATKFSKPDIRRLLDTVNSQCSEGQRESNVLDKVFETFWPQLEKDITRVLSEHKAPAPQKIRSDRELLEEILNLSRARTAPPMPQHQVSETMRHKSIDYTLHWYTELYKRLGPGLDDPSRYLFLRLRESIDALISVAAYPELYARLIPQLKSLPPLLSDEESRRCFEIWQELESDHGGLASPG